MGKHVARITYAVKYSFSSRVDERAPAKRACVLALAGVLVVLLRYLPVLVQLVAGQLLALLLALDVVPPQVLGGGGLTDLLGLRLVSLRAVPASGLLGWTRVGLELSGPGV